MSDDMTSAASTEVEERTENVLMASPTLSRGIIHRLQRGEHIDPYLGREFRFLDRNQAAWEDFFCFLGYTLCRSDLGGESYFYVKPGTGQIRAERLSRGSTFVGIYLAWHFLTQGMEGLDSVAATELAGRILGQFDFNMLVPVFLPQKGRGRQRAETEQNRDKLLGAIRTALNDLARYRFVDLRPSPRTEWNELQIWRLPALQRFLEISRTALLQQGGEGGTPEAVLQSLWTGIDSEPENEEPEEIMEDEA